MAKTVTKYTIFLSSPSDLGDERAAIDDVIKELNLTYGNANNCVIELIKWETHSAPGISKTYTQEIINEDIGDDYDIFLGILWTRFGTPTLKANSGTEEEFNRALTRFEKSAQPQILFYFKNSGTNTLSDIDPEQLIKVHKFKQSIPKDKMLYWEFDTVGNLQNFLRIHIPKRIESIVKKLAVNVTLKDTDEISDLEEFGLIEYNEQFEELMSDSSKALDKINKWTEWIGTEITDKALELNELAKNLEVSKNNVIILLKRTAKLMNDYSDRLKVEIPIFYNSFEEGIKVGISLLNLSEDFSKEDSIRNLEGSKEAVIVLATILPEALEGIKLFRESVSKLPRIQIDINMAKKVLLNQLDELIEKLNKSYDLVIEFLDRITSKLNKYSLQNL